MMKTKIVFSSLAVFSVLAGNFVGTTANITTLKASAKTVTAEYISLEEVPVIDGEIDEVWSLTSVIDTNVSKEGTKGSICILWNESGLYFLAQVVDYSLNRSDLCNLWVSENFFTQGEYDFYDYYAQVDGAYYLCLNHNAENAFYSPDALGENYCDMTAKYTAVGTKTKDENGYILEVYVPLTGDKALEEGKSIGFDVSIDDYLQPSNSIEGRESYVNWNGLPNYWEYPSCLGEVILQNSSSSEQKPSDSNDGQSGDTTDKKGNSGCNSSVAFPFTLVSLGVCSFFVARKRKD